MPFVAGLYEFQIGRYDLELARMFARDLQATTIRVGTGAADPQLVLLFRLTPKVGRTVLAHALSAELAGQLESPTVYTEYPTAENLPRRFAFKADGEIYNHPAGYDIFLPQPDSALPPAVQATLLLDGLLAQYRNIVISLPADIEEGVAYFLERADQVVVVASPDKDIEPRLNALLARIKRHIHPERAALFTVINRPLSRHKTAPAPDGIDFDLPFLPQSPRIAGMEPLDASLIEWATALVNRLGRAHQIAVYIPTTINVNQEIDTRPYVERALAFLGERFGGATSREADGVWHSDAIGLVNEKVFIVRSYITQADMTAHLDDVIAFVERLKTELQQEAMAVEVDQRLMFV